MTFSEPATEIFAALAQAQGEIDAAKKDAKGQVGSDRNYKYADLASVLEAAKGPMAKAGLALTFDTTSTDNQVILQPALLHKSGQWIKYEPYAVRLAKGDAQGQGSGLTYGRRYLIQTILGIAAEDDDGHAASHRPQETRKEPVQAPSKPVETRPEPSVPGVTKGVKEQPKHPAWVKGGADLKALFTSEIDGHPAFRDEEIDAYRTEYVKLANPAINPDAVQAKVDKFLADVKAELLKRAEVSEEFAQLTESVTVEDAPANAVEANPQGLF